jgi:hypothetical protein
MRGQTNAASVEEAQEPSFGQTEVGLRPAFSARRIIDYASAAVGIVGGITWVILSASATGPVGLTLGLGLGAAGFFGGCLALLSKISSVEQTQKRGR